MYWKMQVFGSWSQECLKPGANNKDQRTEVSWYVKQFDYTNINDLNLITLLIKVHTGSKVAKEQSPGNKTVKMTQTEKNQKAPKSFIYCNFQHEKLKGRNFPFLWKEDKNATFNTDKWVSMNTRVEEEAGC